MENRIHHIIEPWLSGTMVIINAPWTLSVAWKVIRRWLDARTVEKIRIVRGPEEYQPELDALIDRTELPCDFGGDGPPLTNPYEQQDAAEVAE